MIVEVSWSLSSLAGVAEGETLLDAKCTAECYGAQYDSKVSLWSMVNIADVNLYRIMGVFMCLIRRGARHVHRYDRSTD